MWDWEIIADDIARMGCSYGYHRLILEGGIPIWQVDARRNEGFWYVVRAETLRIAFMDLRMKLEQADHFPEGHR